MTLRNLIVPLVLAACALPATSEARSIPSVLFSITSRGAVRTGGLSETTLYENGTWTVTVDDEDRSGHLSRADMATIRKDLRTSKWITTEVIACQAIGGTL